MPERLPTSPAPAPGTRPPGRRGTRFSARVLRTGYARAEVDAFWAALDADLAAADPQLGANYVTAARFTPVRLRVGYHPDQVDALRALVAAELVAAGRVTGPIYLRPRPRRRSRVRLLAGH